MTAKSFDVVIIGAGLAGAIAARELAATGLQTVVLEARDRVGGRVEYRKFAGTDALVEMGGTSVSVGSATMDREVERYGIQRLEQPSIERRIWHLAGREQTGGFPIPLAEAAEAERVQRVITEAARRITIGVPHDQQRIADLDISVATFIDKLEPPPATRDLLRAWVSRQGLGDASALWYLHSIAKLGGPVALSQMPVYRIAGGAATVVSALLADSGAEVHLSTPVARLAQDDTAVTVTTATGEELNAARAVVAVPMNVLGKIDFTPELNEAKRTIAAERHAGETVKLFVLAENIPERVSVVGAGLGNMSWYATEQMLPEGNLLVGFGYPADGFDPTNLDHVQDSLGRFVPDAKAISIDSHDWVADPYSLGTHMVPRPGQLTTLMSGMGATEGRLHFAGADIAPGWLSYMEGALESGRRAADDVRTNLHLGRPGR